MKKKIKENPRESFIDFAKAVYPFLEFTPFHRTYYTILEAFARGRIPKLIVSVPPQHGKSVGATTLLPAYMLGLDPDMRIAIASYSGTLASKFNRRVQRILESREYGEIFPATTIKRGTKPAAYIRTSDEVEIIDHKGELISVGREGSLTGNRVDCFILDDLYKDAMEAQSPVVRRIAGSGTPRWCAHVCTTPHANLLSLRAGTKRTLLEHSRARSPAVSYARSRI